MTSIWAYPPPKPSSGRQQLTRDAHVPPASNPSLSGHQIRQRPFQHSIPKARNLRDLRPLGTRERPSHLYWGSSKDPSGQQCLSQTARIELVLTPIIASLHCALATSVSAAETASIRVPSVWPIILA